MIQKAMSWNNLAVLFLSGAAIFAIEVSPLIQPEVLGTATRSAAVLIAVGLGVYRKPT